MLCYLASNSPRSIYFKNSNTTPRLSGHISIERFHPRVQHLCRFLARKENVCIRNEFNSHMIGLGHQHGCCFIVLGHRYGHRDVK